MKNQMLFNLLMVVFLWFPTKASAGGSGGVVKINISIDKAIHIDRVNVTYCNDYYGFTYFWNQAPMMKAQVVNGKVELGIPIDSTYGYVKLDFVGKNRRHPILRQLSECHFFTHKGGNVDILVGDTCVFEGSQGATYQIQYDTKTTRSGYDAAYRAAMDEMVEELSKHLADSGTIYSRYLAKTRLIDGMLVESIEDMIHNAPVLSGLEQAVLIANEQYDIANRFLKNAMFQTSIGLYSGSDVIRQAILEDYLKVVRRTGDWGNDFARRYSWAFIDYMYFKTLTSLGLPLQAVDPQARVQFSQLYESILYQTAGSIRDRLLTVALLNFSSTREIPDRFYEQVSELIKDTQSTKLITNIARKRATGVLGFPFHLPDTADNMVSFDELKGKVVVLDFWFTGCHGCISLAKAMKAVGEYYRDNTDVVFVNISVDTDRERWRKSVRSGLYSHEGSISLYTAGRGADDPAIKHYNVVAYPTLVVFDREGRVAYFNPRGPYNDTDEALFIRRIDGLL